MWQAKHVRDVLTNHYQADVEIKVINTRGDKLDDVAFAEIEGKGFFTKEIEDALLAGEIDVAVHSLKDLMTTQPEGLKLGAVGYRGDRRDVLIIRKESYEKGGVLPVKDGRTVGTGSTRRQFQITYHGPSLKAKDLRGNVPTRLQKLRDGDCDACIIAAAGIKRLRPDLSDMEVIYLDPEVFMPAPGQGILGMQIRVDDPDVEKVIGKLGSREEWIEAHLERSLLRKFDSGCSLPLGVFSQITGSKCRLSAMLGVRDGDAWSAPRRSVAVGDDLEKVVEEVYQALSEATEE
jgi:hydroxymethylbilane synthase